MKKEIICTVCPIGCLIMIEGEGENITSISGNQCKRGLEYGTSEFSHPVRILTTTVKVEGFMVPLLPVRSSKPISKELIMACMDQIKKVTIFQPIKSKAVVISNVCGSGVDIVATASIE
jgi:CxxC motif-containing protein